MRQIPKTELSPDNGCIIDMKWKLGPLSYHSSAAGKIEVPMVTEPIRLPELVLYDHVGFKGAYARTNLSFHYIGDFWNDRISCLIVVSGVWRFYDLLPFAPTNKVVTIGEGQTLLHPSEGVARYVGVKGGNLFLQYEGMNPSGSFKDNGMTAAFTHAHTTGARRAACDR